MKKILYLLLISASSLFASENLRDGTLMIVDSQFPAWEEGVRPLTEHCFKVMYNKFNHPSIGSRFRFLPLEMQNAYKRYVQNIELRKGYREDLLITALYGFSDNCCFHVSPEICGHKKNIPLYLSAINKLIPILQRIRHPMNYYVLLGNIHNLYGLTEVEDEKSDLRYAAYIVMRNLMMRHSGKDLKRSFKGLLPSWDDLLKFAMPHQKIIRKINHVKDMQVTDHK